LIEANGWPAAELQTIELRDILDLPHRGVVDVVRCPPWKGEARGG
jgi:hypothetical protein